MRAVVQRVAHAAVHVGGETIAATGPGLMVLVGVENGDTPADAAYMAEKTMHLRIFEDADGKLNRSLLDTAGEVLAVSQFTLLGDCRKGRRPSFTAAAPSETGKPLFDAYVAACRSLGAGVQVGEFGAVMQVELVNDGPVTLVLDSRRDR
ncbi:MAG: D-aminoacyl-tRNA deacylase [Bacillota bacterium]|nr:D-aminoacyl-tRNA deacylase [Bacillota bacterium]